MVDTPDRMREEPEFDLVKPAADLPTEDRAPRPVGWWMAGALLVVAAGFAGYYFVTSGASVPPPEQLAVTPSSPPAESISPSATPLEAAGTMPVDVPPLDASDAVVRTLVTALSANPRVAAWLTTNGLIRNFTVIVANIADGVTPARHLSVLRPTGPFQVVTRGRDVRVDARSFERYNAVAAAAASLDPIGAARLYTTLKPRIDEAYRDLGQPDVPFDRTLERAIVRLLEVPVVEGALSVKEQGGTGYGLVDTRLEDLTAAQKQLLRMGPDNVRTIQGALRAFAQALGMPASRLPQPRTIRAS